MLLVITHDFLLNKTEPKISGGMDSREVFDGLNQLQVSYWMPCEFSLSLSPQLQRFLYNAVSFLLIYIHILHWYITAAKTHAHRHRVMNITKFLLQQYKWWMPHYKLSWMSHERNIQFGEHLHRVSSEAGLFFKDLLFEHSTLTVARVLLQSLTDVVQTTYGQTDQNIYSELAE